MPFLRLESNGHDSAYFKDVVRVRDILPSALVVGGYIRGKERPRLSLAQESDSYLHIQTPPS